jgi:hypothetical protein
MDLRKALSCRIHKIPYRTFCQLRSGFIRAIVHSWLIKFLREAKSDQRENDMVIVLATGYAFL